MPPSDADGIETSKAIDPKTKPIRIGLLSDTHIPRDVKTLPPHVKEAFKNVDMILHAGDIYLPKILDELESIAPVMAAIGNGDKEYPDDHRFSEQHILEIGGLQLGLTHAVDYPDSPQYPIERAIERKFGKRMDVIVFGDTHVAMVKRHTGMLMLNPGSPTLPNGRFHLGTVALLEIAGGRAEARIIHLSEFPIPFDRQSIYYRGIGA